MDMLKNAAKWLADKMMTTNGFSVGYKRAGTGNAPFPVPAVVGKTMFDVDEGYGQITRYESRDFLVEATDLIGPGFNLEDVPERGDRIIETVTDTDGAGTTVTYTYEVMAPSGQAVWEYADAFRNLIRIHTKLVDQQVAV